MIGQRQQMLKLHLLTRPKTVPKKQNLDQKINYSKPNIWSLSFNFKFSSRKIQIQQKLVKKIAHFLVQFRSKNLTYLTNLNLLNIVKNIPSNAEKNSLT